MSPAHAQVCASVHKRGKFIQKRAAVASRSGLSTLPNSRPVSLQLPENPQLSPREAAEGLWQPIRCGPENSGVQASLQLHRPTGAASVPLRRSKGLPLLLHELEIKEVVG